MQVVRSGAARSIVGSLSRIIAGELVVRVPGRILFDLTNIEGVIELENGQRHVEKLGYHRQFAHWLEQLADDSGGLAAIYFEEVRRHIGTDAAHLYGGFLATLTAWCEREGVAYQGVPVGTIKRFATGKGNAGKDAVLAAMRQRGFQPADDNEADAIAILLWALATRGGVL